MHAWSRSAREANEACRAGFQTDPSGTAAPPLSTLLRRTPKLRWNTRRATASSVGGIGNPPCVMTGEPSWVGVRRLSSLIPDATRFLSLISLSGA